MTNVILRRDIAILQQRISKGLIHSLDRVTSKDMLALSHVARLITIGTIAPRTSCAAGPTAWGNVSRHSDKERSGKSCDFYST